MNKKEAEKEILEQCRLNGKGAEREADLFGKLERFEKKAQRLVEALQKAMTFYISDGKVGLGWYQEASEALKKWEEGRVL